MKARAFILACAVAGLLPALAFADTPFETDAPPTLQAGPRIIHVPEPPKSAPKRHIEHPSKPAEPKRHVEQPQPQPEPKRQVEQPQPEPKRQVEQPLQPSEPAESVAPGTAKPTPSQTPSTPFRRPAQTKTNRKIWI